MPAAALVAVTAYSAYSASQASKDAAKSQSKSADAASQVQWDMYNQTREDQAPYRAIGNSALAQLGYGIGAPQSAANTVPQDESTFDAKAYLAANPDVANAKIPYHGVDYRSNPYQHYLDWGKSEGREFTYTSDAQKQLDAYSPSGQAGNGIGLGEFNKKFSLADYQADPGYQFRLDEGSKALERSAAARGGLLSGGNLKDLTNYQQGVASQEYGNAYNRFNNDQSSRFNRLAALAGVGQTANNTLATVGSNTAANIGSNLIGSGNAQAAGTVGSANAYNNAIGQGISAYQNNQYLNAIKPVNRTTSANYYNDYSSVA